MAHSVVHKAAPGAVEAVLERLCTRGVEAQAVDDPNLIALLFSFGTYRVRISVPDDQVEDARRILTEWDREVGPNVAALSRQVHRQFLVAIVPAIGAAALLLALGASWTLAVLSLLLVWFASLVAIGVVQRRRAIGLARRRPHG